MKTKELPAQFNPLVNKFEPILPTKQGNAKFEKRKINKWMLGYLIVTFLLFIIVLINLARK